MKIHILLVILVAALAVAAPTADGADTLIAAGATWKYLDDGSNQGTAWAGLAFDDSAWASGPAQLGYGDGDENTVVSFGPNSGNKYITTYFRHSFTVADASLYRGLELLLLRDDGARVYLNGTEVVRTNLPAGTINYLTRANDAIGGDAEDRFNRYPVDNLLVTGTNVIAVEIHQASSTSSDISLDASLIAYTSSDPTELRRGPYLQTAGTSQITICWRTQVSVDARVRYGLAPGNLTMTADDVTVGTEHAVELTGLAADTVYYYQVGTTAGEAIAGDDTDHVFRTAPPVGTRSKARIWVIGDSGTADANAEAVRDAYLAYPDADATNLWLMLGDNAYDDGTDEEYQAAVFDMYPSLLRRFALWPTLGNHDAYTADSTTESGPYYDIFRLPRAAEAGGMASGTEAYYSFDFANIHFVCLDSEDSNRLPSGAMLQWLQNDLASTTQDWIIAFWHHPPYTKGSHDSDNAGDSGGRMRQMRLNALPILEAAGVDLVLSGHSHSYERSFLLNGHYLTSNTLTPEMILDGGDGRENSDGAYVKASQGLAGNEGTVYIVAGSSGKTSAGPLNHPVMFRSIRRLGSVVLDVEGHRMDIRFLNNVGVGDDWLTLYKGEPESDANAFTATFADGTLGGLVPKSGSGSVVTEGLEVTTASAFEIPVLAVGEARLQTRVGAGLPAGAAVGLRMTPTAMQSATLGVPGPVLELTVEHDGSGNLLPRLLTGGFSEGAGSVVTGTLVAASADSTSTRLRLSFDGARAKCFVNDTLALDHPLSAPVQGTPSVVGSIRANAPGTLRLEYVVFRSASDIPGVHFDSEGRQWIALAEDDLMLPFADATFSYRESEVTRDWTTFVSELLPSFDRIEESDDHLYLIGRSTPALPPGTITGVTYKGETDEAVDR